MSLNSLIDAAVEKNNDELVKSLQELIRINSVCSDPKPGMPFGEGAAKALENADGVLADLGRELAAKLGAECVIVIGRKAVLYRRSKRKDVEHIEL